MGGLQEGRGERHLDWQGCFNVRDLGGLRTADGRMTKRGVLVRADDLDLLSEAGWAELCEYGIRTVVDLRNQVELLDEPPARPPSIVTLNVPMDDDADTSFWQRIWREELDGSPLYYTPFLEEKPERCVEVITAIARAEPGVVFHCGRGRDRTGLIALILLALVGVPPSEIVADYEMSAGRLARRFELLGEENENDEIASILERKRQTIEGLILRLLESFDLDAYLRSKGLKEEDVSALRARFLGSGP
jgi:protein tyrosine/serine phosphatase